MEAGIIGLPNVGKSTLFNALTAAAPGKGALAANYPFATIEPNVGVVSVPDARLTRISQHIPTQKIIPAALRLVDIAGLVKGASKGEGLGNQFLSHIRNVDAILHVVRCFDDPDVAHVDGNADPVRDIETIETELMLADLESVESSLDKGRRTARSGDKDARARVALLEKCQAVLSEGKPARGLDLDDNESKLLKSLGLLTAKKALIVANVDEDDLRGENELVERVRNHLRAQHASENVEHLLVPVCAKLEAELAELDEADRMELLESVGLEEPALNVLARRAYELLGLQSYFTAGPKEIRAWTIPIGATGPQAAGVIHSDFERGFIRAEVYGVNDLAEHGSEKAIREAGKMRVEGKSYILADGDVCHFLFNV